MLKYPNDRVGEYVQLRDGSGNLFVSEFTRFSTDTEEGLAMRCAGAFLILCSRHDEDTSEGRQFS